MSNCNCKKIMGNIITFDKLLSSTSEVDKENKNHGVEALFEIFVVKIKEIVPDAKKKNIILAAGYIAAGHTSGITLLNLINKGTSSKCTKNHSIEKEQNQEETSNKEPKLSKEDLDYLNEHLKSIFGDKSIKAHIIRVPKEKE